jgi:hypothetical protein
LLPVGQRIDVPVNARIAVIRGSGHDRDSISNVMEGSSTKAECRLPMLATLWPTAQAFVG